MNESLNSRFLFISGPIGSGKTTLCQGIINNHPEYIYLSLDRQRASTEYGMSFIESPELRQQLLRVIDQDSLKTATEDPRSISPYFDHRYSFLEYQRILLNAFTILECNPNKKVLIECLLLQRRARNKVWDYLRNAIPDSSPQMIQILSDSDKIYSQVENRLLGFDEIPKNIITPERAVEIYDDFQEYNPDLEKWLPSSVLKIKYGAPLNTLM